MELILSASSLSTYLECPLQWYFSYVLAERGHTSLKKVIGIAVHDSIEAILRHLQLADGTALDPVMTYQQFFDREMDLGPIRFAKDDDLDEGRASGLKALQTYLSVMVVNDDVSAITHVEVPFEIDINGIPYSGTIDRIDDNDVVRDTKITHSRPKRGKYRLNVIGYGLGAETLTGRQPSMSVLDYIVRTKEPYYWPEYIDPPSPVDVADFAHQLSLVAEGIDAGKFEPLGLSSPFACVACPHSASCGPYQRMQDNLATEAT